MRKIKDLLSLPGEGPLGVSELQVIILFDNELSPHVASCERVQALVYEKPVSWNQFSQVSAALCPSCLESATFPFLSADGSEQKCENTVERILMSRESFFETLTDIKTMDPGNVVEVFDTLERSYSHSFLKYFKKEEIQSHFFYHSVNSDVYFVTRNASAPEELFESLGWMASAREMFDKELADLVQASKRFSDEPILRRFATYLSPDTYCVTPKMKRKAEELRLSWMEALLEDKDYYLVFFFKELSLSFEQRALKEFYRVKGDYSLVPAVALEYLGLRPADTAIVADISPNVLETTLVLHSDPDAHRSLAQAYESALALEKP